jgi:transaldolase
MKFFIDTANIEEIKRINEYGFVDGVTTNPSLIAKEGRDFKEAIEEICSFIDGPVSAEVGASDFEGMVEQGEKLAKIAPNVCIKLPLTMEGLKACFHFSKKNVKTNVTLCFSTSQAILAAKAGATFVSPFVGRLDDINQNGLTLIEEINDIYQNYDKFRTEILVASIRNPCHITESAIIGADVVTIPAKVFDSLVHHHLTDKGLGVFDKDWKSSGQKI